MKSSNLVHENYLFYKKPFSVLEVLKVKLSYNPVSSSVGPSVGSFVRWSIGRSVIISLKGGKFHFRSVRPFGPFVRWSIDRSVIISLKGGKFHFNAPVGAHSSKSSEL